MLEVGRPAPKFKLPDAEGRERTIADLAGPKGLVLYFYPKDSTPGCTTEACDFRDTSAALKRAGWHVAGVSKDSAASHQKFAAKQNLNFPLLSDESGAMLEAYGVWREKNMMGRKYMGIVRTTVLVGADGKLKRVFENVKVAGHALEVLSAAKES